MCKEAFSKRLVQLRMAKGVSARDMSPTSYRTALLRVNMNLLSLPIIPPKRGFVKSPSQFYIPSLKFLSSRSFRTLQSGISRPRRS